MAGVGASTTDFLHFSNDSLSGFAPIGTVNCTHVHTSQLNIVLFPAMSSRSDQIAKSPNKIMVLSWLSLPNL